MAGFMNDELRTLKCNLVCGYCKNIFTGTDSQARKVKYEKRVVYCTTACRRAGHTAHAIERALSSPTPPPKYRTFGPCPTCGQMFKKRVAGRVYCNAKCYRASPKFKEHCEKIQKLTQTPEQIALRAEKAKTGQDRPCVGCGKMMYVKKHKLGRNTYCTHVCYETYMSARFERVQDMPEFNDLPKDYDAFLAETELPCVVKGCVWKGKHLSLHVNLAHAVNADTLKRVLGFDLSEGIVSSDLSERLSQRENVGVALLHGIEEARAKAHAVLAAQHEAGIPRYVSEQRRQTQRKICAIKTAVETGPKRLCVGCGVEFTQRSPFGLTLYCTRTCRDKDYAEAGKLQRRSVYTVRGAKEWLGR